MANKVTGEILEKSDFTVSDMVRLLSIDDGKETSLLYEKAYEIKTRFVGRTVYLRGLIEMGNICEKNCLYCGIRKGNRAVERYIMSEDEILDAARLAWECGYGSVVLQSGEMRSEKYSRFIEKVIRKIQGFCGWRMGITLSLGEQTADVYRRWFDAGAHRYLLRIETSDRDLYGMLHPAKYGFERRVECLRNLKDIGYMTGTGVIIGLPGQTAEQLVRDVLFFKDIDADMIGMGPYIPHHNTPMARSMNDFNAVKRNQLDLALRMIALTRIVLRDVNIASATALQAIDDEGRELGILAGANVIMPNVTPVRYRRGYQLYDNKPCLDENESVCRGRLEMRIRELGEEIGYNQWGDSPHYDTRKISANYRRTER